MDDYGSDYGDGPSPMRMFGLLGMLAPMVGMLLFASLWGVVILYVIARWRYHRAGIVDNQLGLKFVLHMFRLHGYQLVLLGAFLMLYSILAKGNSDMRSPIWRAALGFLTAGGVVFGAHTANMAENGLPGERYRGYLLERAKGGAAMIVSEPVPVHRTGVLTRGNFRHEDDSIIPAFRKILEPVKDAGAVVLQQIYHIGAHGDSDLSFQPHWSPSGGPSYHDSDGSHRVTESEIEELIAAHIAAARRSKEAGFHGVEVWAAYHSLLDQFWTPWSNKRDDQWGGSLENRTRFSRRIIEGIRKTCGEDFIIGLAISTSDSQPVLLQGETLAEVVAYHDATGHVDYVTCGAGSYLEFDAIIPPFTHGEKLTTPMTALPRCTRLSCASSSAG